MMVHVEHAPITGRTVVAPFWFEYIAHQTVTTPLVFVVAQVESPEDWDLSRIGRHRLEKRPEKHDENDVVHNEKG